MDRESGQPLSFLSFLAFVFLATATGSSYAAGARYSSSWAVEVRGGSAMADTLAHKYGFANLGQVKLTVIVIRYSFYVHVVLWGSI